MSTNIARLLATVALVGLPLSARAQTGSLYVPPKLVKAGTSTSAASGSGNVTVQVFVKKDGSFNVTHVIKTTNASNNAAALEIAKTSSYKPAQRDGKPVDGFYDYTLKFANAGVASTSPTAAAYAAIRAGKYADAKAQLQTYLQAHPGDVQANTLLGVANAFSGDNGAAAAAFDNVPSVPDQYKNLAAQAYGKNASALLGDQKFKEAATSAGHVIELSPASPQGYYLRGVASANQQNFQAALPDLQKALGLAKDAKADDKTLAQIDMSLSVAQLNTGAYDAAAASGKEALRYDPSLQSKLAQAQYAAVMNDAVAQANAGKISDAVTRLENGATLFPADAGNFYGQAAFIMLTDKTPDYKKLKTESDKALAVDSTNGRALLVSAFVAAQAGDQKTALANMNKAKASPLYSSDPVFAKQVDDNLKKLSAPAH